MKRFVFTRLHERDQDYDFYVPLSYNIGGIRQLIYSDTLDSRSRLFLLEREGGQITFGIREQLDLRDVRGRRIFHFTGFQLDPNEGAECVPSFTALKNVITEITSEAISTHEILDQDPSQGGALKTVPLFFESVSLQSGNPWDDVVRGMRADSKNNLLVMFGEDGSVRPLPSSAINKVPTVEPASQRASSTLTPDDRTDRNGSFAGQTNKGRRRAGSDFSGSAGIKSGVELEPHERAYLPPLEPFQPEKSLFDLWADSAVDLWNRLRRRNRNDYNL